MVHFLIVFSINKIKKIFSSNCLTRTLLGLHYPNLMPKNLSCSRFPCCNCSIQKFHVLHSTLLNPEGIEKHEYYKVNWIFFTVLVKPLFCNFSLVIFCNKNRLNFLALYFFNVLNFDQMLTIYKLKFSSCLFFSVF